MEENGTPENNLDTLSYEEFVRFCNEYLDIDTVLKAKDSMSNAIRCAFDIIKYIIVKDIIVREKFNLHDFEKSIHNKNKELTTPIQSFLIIKDLPRRYVVAVSIVELYCTDPGSKDYLRCLIDNYEIAKNNIDIHVENQLKNLDPDLKKQSVEEWADSNRDENLILPPKSEKNTYITSAFLPHKDGTIYHTMADFNAKNSDEALGMMLKDFKDKSLKGYVLLTYHIRDIAKIGEDCDD